ncbi:MAG TPA: hypothetical protein VGS41_00415 [Chthonomonadales bacterium]|nr:hypothetical protein [Chthonomonadales bacterium]
MTAIALILLFCWIACTSGRFFATRLLSPVLSHEERLAFSGAVGLGAAAYGVLALGLAGKLTLAWVTGYWIILALFGLFGAAATIADVRGAAASLASDLKPARGNWRRAIAAASIAVVIGCGAASAASAFLPPSGHEWDALAYHLADPAVFLSHHRIDILPTEHHSNFPFTTEMLFTVGLLYQGYALANLFHLATAALTAMAMLGFCRRMTGTIAGYIAVLVFATTPVVLWEAGVAYIDVALGLYVTLSTFAAVTGICGSREPGNLQGRSDFSSLLMLAGVCMGFALGVKYLALIPLGLICIALILYRAPARVVAGYLVPAVIVASPWYLKSAIEMRNPVYPYLFSLFPHSRYWSAGRAATYSSEQNGFGLAHSLKQPASALRNLAQSPWSVIAEPYRYTNGGDFTFAALAGGLYAAFGFALALQRKVRRGVVLLAWIGLTEVISWFFVAQVIRYLVSYMPVLAIVCGYSAARIAGWTEKEDEAKIPFASYLVAAVLAAQAAFTFWSLFALPTSAVDAMAAGMMPAAVSMPEIADMLSGPGSRSEALSRELEFYPAEQWINNHTGKNEGVAIYDETRGYYLRRPYLWANGEHSAYIPYRNMRNGLQLSNWMLQHGIEYAMINLRWSPAADASAAGALNGNEAQFLDKWYVHPTQPQEHWRQLVADAIARGYWTVQFAEHGVVVLRITSSQSIGGAG